VLALSANLSSKHFSQGDVVAEIEQILLECDFPPQALRLEVTESVILDNIESAATILSRLKSLGVQLSLDDFGTGYSSLSYLHRLPLDTLKVDRSFVARMGGKDDNTEIVRAIVTLARNMKMAVIAEGVETTEQARILRELNCDYAQGFYFSRPVPAEEAAKFLETGKAWPAFVSANSRNGDGALPQSEPLGPMPQTE
jgi:EAL domain-containing protein (putative c-di-GMP-specific phosphodiesterase class I)